MDNTIEDAKFLLRILAETKGVYFFRLELLQAFCAFEEEAFIRAIDYLKTERFIVLRETTSKSIPLTVECEISEEGFKFYEKFKEDLIDLNLDALRILRFCGRSVTPVITIKKIRHAFYDFRNEDDLVRTLIELRDRGYIEAFDPSTISSVKITLQGRNAVYSNFRYSKPTNSTSIQIGSIGAIVQNSPISGGLQAVGSAQNSTINQGINTEVIKKEIEELLVDLVNNTVQQLEAEQGDQYQKIANQLNIEVQKEHPDPGVLQKALAGLSFFSDLGGAITFGTGIFNLIAQNGPTIMALANKIAILLQSLPK